MGVFYEFDEVDAFTAGAIGQPGDRVFFLQARQGRQRVTVKCEKQQVSAIVQYLQRCSTTSRRPTTGRCRQRSSWHNPSSSCSCSGPIGLGYDRAADRLIVQLEEIVRRRRGRRAEVERPTTATSALYVTRGQAAAFCEHAERVVAAGRPDCQWCDCRSTPTATHARG